VVSAGDLRYIRVGFAVPLRACAGGQCWLDAWIRAEERNGMESRWLRWLLPPAWLAVAGSGAVAWLAGWLAGSSGGDVPGWLLGARTTWMAPPSATAPP